MTIRVPGGALLFSMVVAGAMAALHAAPARGDALELYVSPEGRDTWSGTLAAPAGDDGPFATLARARDEVRKAKADGRLAEGATVHVRGGTYPLTETFELGAEDSGTAEGPVVYRAYEQEKPVLVGAAKVTDFRPTSEILQATSGHPEVIFRQLFFRERMEMPAAGVAEGPPTLRVRLAWRVLGKRRFR